MYVCRMCVCACGEERKCVCGGKWVCAEWGNVVVCVERMCVCEWQGNDVCL